MEIDIFIPCIVDQYYPETGFNMVKILEKLSIKCFFNANQSCCGQMSFNSGYWEETKQLGEKFIKDFNRGRMVVSPSVSCIGMIHHHYPLMFHNTSQHNELKSLQSNVFELTDFLVNKMNVTTLGAIFNYKVVIHDCCTGKNDHSEELRLLLKRVRGIEILEINQKDCGFGGAFSNYNEPISLALVQQLVESAMAAGAEYIVVSEASCRLQIDSYLKKNKLSLKTIHIADLLASGWEE